MLIFTKLEQEPVKAQRSRASVSTVEQSLPSINHSFQNLTHSNPSVFRRFSTQVGSTSFNLFNKVLIALFFITSFSVDSYATHDRGGTLSWQQAGGNSIKFTLNTSWRRSYYGTPVVGSVILLNGAPNTFNFGDGSSVVTSMAATVTSIDAAEDVLTATWTVIRTYSQPGNYTVSYLNCCRLSDLKDGNNDTNFKLETIVNVGSPFNSPPTSALPAVINLAVNQSAATFTVPYSDPDGNTVTFRPSTTAESGLTMPVPVDFNITSSGVVTFSTVNKSIGDLFSVQIMMSDGRTKVAVDFIIEIVGPSSAPFFISPTPLPPNNVFNILPGNTLNFTVVARDFDVGQYVTLNPVAAPIGSTMSPALPVVGSVNGTASSNFRWTPAANQVGNYVVTFVAADNVGVQKLTSITINVLCGLSATVSNTTSASCPSTSDGAAQITVQNFTTASNLIYIWTGPNGFSANTQNIANVGSGSYSVRVIDNANGCSVTKPVIIGTVPDITLPIITCPANIPCVEATNPKGAIVNFPSAIASDNCSSVNITSSMPSGSMFSIGTNTVIYTATDGSNNTANCSFTVTICDTSPPDIQNTPLNIPCVEATSASGAVVTYVNPTATDIVDGAVSVFSVPASGSTFPLGITTVVSTATDANGNSASTSFTATVCDRTPPVIYNTPPNIPCVEATSPAGAVVFYPNPTATDIVDGAVAVTSLPASGSTFPIGITTVTSTATDAHGNSASTSFTVTVCDKTPPVVTCPANIPCVERTSYTGAVVNYPAITAMDIVDGDVTVLSYLPINGTNIPPTGGSFIMGLNTVRVSATDAHGNSSSCSFTIKVCDTQPPVVNCPANIPCVEATSPAGAVVTYPNNSVGIDSYGNEVQYITAISDKPSGTTFPVGLSTVTMSSTDDAGNKGSCSFTIEVCDKTPPDIHNTPANIPCVEATSPAGAVVNYANPTATDIVDGAVVVTSVPASGSVFPLGTTTVTSTATDAHGNSASTSFTVTVCDRTPPVIHNTPANIPCVEATSPAGAVVNYANPTATDIVDGAVAVTSVPASGTVFPLGTTTVTSTATDAQGNSASTSFTVTVCDRTPPVVSCPANIPCVEATSPAGAVVTYSSVMATDIVDGTVTAYSVLSSGSTFAIGSNTVVATATDAHGNSASCSFTIQVCDTRAPAIACPANITVEASGPSGAVVTYPSATAIDIVDGSVATFSVLPSGSTFPIGLSTVISTATDAHGNSTTCSFTVKVNNTPPVITCPANIPCVEATSAAGAIVAYSSATAIDYTGTSISVTSILASGSTFPLGTSTVVATATDNTGKSSSCSFTVKVCDKTSPVITCPTPLNLNTSPSSCSAVAVFSAPTATDIVTASPTITQTSGLTSGVSYPIGITTNSFTATDAAGNVSSCSFTVKVTDNIAPIISCPAPLSKNTDLGQCSAITTFIAPTATDNCSATITQTSGLVSGASYPKGITTNTFKATDAAGNMSSCSFTITVIDNEKPTITAPAAINACAAVGAPIALGTPITADNCGITSVTNNAPAAYTVGTTIVTWIVTDNSGNTATATQSVTVNYNAFDATKCYKIVNRNANKVLEVSQGSNADNAPILQNEYRGDIFQKWQFASVGNGYVKIVSKKNGKVMASVTTNNSGRVFQSTYAAGGSMDWKIECLTAPYLKITHRLTGKVLDIKNSTLDDDGPTIVNTFSATSISQQWSVVEVSCTANENLIANSNQSQADAQSLNFSGTNKKRVTDFTIYPNPATKETWVDMTPFEGQHVMLMVTDILGKMMQQEVIQRASAAPHRLDVVNFPMGLYLVKVQVQGEQVLMKKLQVTN